MVYTPPSIIPAPLNATFTYNASDARDAVSDKPATVSIAVAAAAVNEDLVVTCASVTARSNIRYTWDLAGTTSRRTGNTITVTASTTGTGARWRVSVTTTGNGPSPSPTVTIHSIFGQNITVPIASH